MKSRVLLFNPRAAKYKPRIPNSILQVAASIHSTYEWTIVDGNLEKDSWLKIDKYLSTGEYTCFGCSVMPGPQLKEAIPISKKIREKYPAVTIVWGGYFASNQYKVCLNSGFVDYVVNGPGDSTFPQLLKAIAENLPLENIKNLIYKKEDKFIKTGKDELPDLDKLPQLPYDALNKFYPIERYLGPSYLGKKTLAYHSSFGCPFTCSFCAVVPIYNARWKGKSALGVYSDVKALKDKYGADAIEFHDNNFFVSEKRVVEFAKLIKNENMVWWGEARIDTMDKYKDESLQLIKEAGCKMIFFGAETGSDEILKKMDKGGTQTAEQIVSFAERLKKFGIIPEYSFVLGTPLESESRVNKQIDDDIAFIRKIKEVNRETEIIIYTYSPVPSEGSDMYEQVKSEGFKFPETLEDWISPAWENFDLRKNPLTPWLKPYMIDKIRNFETVLNAYHPTVSDIKLSPVKKLVFKLASIWRYKLKLYTFPKELRLLQVLWKYRQPETEGF
ncbi:B12-binding domain-containing radical SAM protein [Aurantibacillus circumpalustris]|uniref:B12-binding domain-containing radical SAM protein n=1 Tax=Aurantibacillus circumpalustris TaxID=3036359 RepID=UPI00295B6E3C|nr:radical SAM protein [Aurantibacillus circumpalustris]